MSKDDIFPCTDYGNAQRLIEAHGHDLHYVSAWKTWIIWNGTHWEIDELNGIYEKAKLTAREMLEETNALDTENPKRAKMLSWQIKMESEHGLRAMISLARSDPDIALRPNQLDTNPMLLNTPTVTVNLETGSVSEHLPEDLMTKLTGARYHGEQAECSLWLEFLNRIFDGNQETIRFVQKAVGYSLTGDTSEQCLFILYGTGANGKSTFVESVRAMLGDYARAADFSTFMVKKHQGITSDRARLAGARFVSAIEPDASKRLDAALVKQLTGSDTITARHLYQEDFEFRPQFKLWLAANHRPQIRETDIGTWRRIREIPFTVRIPDEEQDHKLAEKLRAELPGILQWAIEGCLAWREEGLKPPETIRKATAEYQAEMDTVGAFIRDRCIEAPNGSATAKEIYAAYEEWCRENGEYCMSKTKLGVALHERGFHRGRDGKRGVWYSGLAIQQTFEVAA